MSSVLKSVFLGGRHVPTNIRRQAGGIDWKSMASSFTLETGLPFEKRAALS